MTDTTLAPTDAEILDAAEDFRSQYTHGGTTFDEFDEIGFARAVLARWGAPAPVAPAQEARESCTLISRIAELAEQHGSLRAAARSLDFDPGYLARLQSGEKCSPSPALLERLGLRQVITYERGTT